MLPGSRGPDCRASVARARCSELATAAALVPSTWAASSDRQRRISHRIRAARWRVGSCSSMAARASRTPSWVAASSAGSAELAGAVDTSADACRRCPSLAVLVRAADPGRYWRRSGTARFARWSGHRSPPRHARPAASSPGRRCPPRTHRLSAGNSRSARAGAVPDRRCLPVPLSSHECRPHRAPGGRYRCRQSVMTNATGRD